MEESCTCDVVGVGPDEKLYSLMNSVRAVHCKLKNSRAYHILVSSESLLGDEDAQKVVEITHVLGKSSLLSGSYDTLADLQAT